MSFPWLIDHIFQSDSRDIYFFDDLELLPRYWQSSNRDNVGELLIAFFHYYHKEFRYTFDVVSIRSEGGILSKTQKGWMNDQPMDGEITTGATPGKEGQHIPANRNAPRDLNRLCIEVRMCKHLCTKLVLMHHLFP